MLCSLKTVKSMSYKLLTVSHGTILVTVGPIATSRNRVINKFFKENQLIYQFHFIRKTNG